MIDFSTNFVKVPRDVVRLLTMRVGRATGATFVALAVYLRLLSRAAWGRQEVRTSHGVVTLEAGQAVFGRGELANEIGANDSAVRSAIELLTRHQLITIESTKRGSIATLVGYSETYDSKRVEPPSVSPSTPPTIHQQATERTAKQTATTRDGSEIRSEIETEIRVRKTPSESALTAADLRKKKIVYAMPDNWAPDRTEENRAVERQVAALGVDIEDLAEEMRDWALARDVPHHDWNALWRTWLARAAEDVSHSARRSG